MREGDHRLVRDLDLFKGMAEKSFEELMQASFLQRFPAGVQLITEGDSSDFLHVVIEGRVELFGQWKGRQTAITFVEPVSTFILAAALKDSIYLMSARTLQPSRVLMIPSPNIRSVFDRDHVFARAVVRELATGYRGLVRTLKNQKLRTGTERLANWLLREHRRSGKPASLALPIEKRVLASLLGMSPENLSRALAALSSYGLTSDGPTINIERPDALERFAEPDRLIDSFED